MSNAEYTTFLNAVDPGGANPNGIYNGGMSADSSNGGITFTLGASLGTMYAAKVGFANKPVTYVSFFDAMRFANWLNNGQGSASTESGAYTLSAGGLGQRNGGATAFVASEDEWYKTAYYDPVSAGADVSGTADYWRYPTQSDSAPMVAVPNGSANQANYDFAVLAVTEGGAYGGSASHFGTFDQAGNVWEWNEAIVFSSSRGLRGGSLLLAPESPNHTNLHAAS